MEATVVRNYIDWLVSPMEEVTEDVLISRTPRKSSMKITGLEDVKERTRVPGCSLKREERFNFVLLALRASVRLLLLAQSRKCLTQVRQSFTGGVRDGETADIAVRTSERCLKARVNP